MSAAAASANEELLPGGHSQGGGHVHGHGGHVHFNPEQVSHHDLEIAVETVVGGSGGGDAMDVHLGFLQVDHVYEVDVPIQHRLGLTVLVCTAGEARLPPSPFIRLTSQRPGVICFELFAHKERLMRETLVLRGGSDAEAPRLTLHFHARVLGKLKGTPALKNGIKCIGIRSDDEADCTSDWQHGSE